MPPENQPFFTIYSTERTCMRFFCELRKRAFSVSESQYFLRSPSIYVFKASAVRSLKYTV